MKRLALHQVIQRLLLFGVPLKVIPAPPAPQPPAQLAPLISALSPSHAAFDARAMYFGHRYRSGFWTIYLLSAVAVLCAIMPLALGWDGSTHEMHPISGLWAAAEVCVIGVVSAIYWLGQRRDWQGRWLTARTTAELTAYLPLLAPLVDFDTPSQEPNWYWRMLDPGQHLRAAGEVSTLCRNNEPLARISLSSVWSDPSFVAAYGRWAVDIFKSQKHYHARLAIQQHALLHRVHKLTGILFGLTALAAIAHLMLHTLWLSLVTTFCPALAASLHGALAQSEAYRLHATSERLTAELQTCIDDVEKALAGAEGQPVGKLTAAVKAAIALILEEHQDWHMLVRPHHLPLA